MRRVAAAIVIALGSACGLNEVASSPGDPVASGGAPDATADTQGDVATDVTGDAADGAPDATLDAREPDVHLPPLDDGAFGAGDAVVSADVAVDVVLPDAALPATAVPVVLDPSATFLGITTDDWVVYATQTGVMAASLAPDASAPQVVSTQFEGEVLVSGRAVLVWTGCAGTCTLGTWTAAAGAHPGASGVRSGYGWASPDGQVVVYERDPNANGSIVTLAAAPLDPPDGGGEVVLQTGVGTSAIPGTCDPVVDFGAGSTALLAACLPGQTQTLLQLATYPFTASTSWQSLGPVQPTAGRLPWTWSADRSRFASTFAGQSVQVVSLPSGQSLFGESLSSPSVWITPDGASFVSAYNSGVFRTDLADPNNAVSLAAGATDVLGLSPDGTQALFYARAPDGGLGSDLYVVGTSGDAGVVAITTQTNARASGAPFTSDGAHVIYDLAQTSTTCLGTTLVTRPVDGGAPRVLDTCYLGGTDPKVATGAKIVYADQEFLFEVDTSRAAPPVPLVFGGAYPTFALNSARRRVVFTYATGAPTDGIYAMPLP